VTQDPREMRLRSKGPCTVTTRSDLGPEDLLPRLIQPNIAAVKKGGENENDLCNTDDMHHGHDGASRMHRG
jgi:hypothetical protein